MSGNIDRGRETARPRPHEGISATAARQGVISGRVLKVLLVSTALVIAGLALAYVFAGR